MKMNKKSLLIASVALMFSTLASAGGVETCPNCGGTGVVTKTSKMAFIEPGCPRLPIPMEACPKPVPNYDREVEMFPYDPGEFYGEPTHPISPMPSLAMTEVPDHDVHHRSPWGGAQGKMHTGR